MTIPLFLPPLLAVITVGIFAAFDFLCVKVFDEEERRTLNRVDGTGGKSELETTAVHAPGAYAQLGSAAR